MTHYPPRVIAIAMCLSALAGYVDALGFLHLGGIFVSFMSGNSTRFAVGLALKAGMRATMTGGIILLFVTGVVCGVLVGKFFDEGRGLIKGRMPGVLGFVSILLLLAAIFHVVGLDAIAIMCMVMAMGAENAVFERNGDITIGLTYMTGTLVKMGYRLAAIFSGGAKMAWLPYFLLWAGLVFGAVIGSLAYAHFGLSALWGAGAMALSLTLTTHRLI